MRDYELFMRDWLMENNPDLIQEYMEDDDIESIEYNDKPYKEGYVFKKELQEAHISEPLSKERNRTTVVEVTSKFLDDHVEQLTEPGPISMFTFTKKDIETLYDMFKLDDPDILDIYRHMVTDTYSGKISKFFNGWVNNAPHKILIIGLAMEAVQKGYDDILECAEYLYAFSEYPILFREYWKTGVNEEVMRYTCEHLPAKFKVRQVHNLQNLLKYDTTQIFNFYKDQMKIGADNTYMDILYRIRNQMNSKFKNIAKHYYKDLENNATQHQKVSTFDDGNIADQEGVNTNMAAIIDKTINKIGSDGIGASVLRIAANRSQVDKSNLQGMMAQIFATKDNKVSRFIENVITYYFKKNPSLTELPAGDFLAYGFSLYRSLSATKDPMLLEVKSIIRFWYNDILDLPNQYKKYTSYERAIFDTMILEINYVQ